MTAEPVMFEDIKGYSCSPMHMWPRVFEATFNAAVEKQVSQVDCTRVGQPCTLHPNLVVIQKAKGVKTPRASACDAKEIKKKQFQKDFQDKLGVRCFFPEPQQGGNSNTGNVSRRVFENSALSAEIFQVPESLLISLHKLLQAISSSKFQDIDQYQEDARRCFDLWTEVFTKTMPANVHLLIAHGHLYLRWAQDEIGIALGALTEGSIEKCNQDVKFTHRRFVAKTSMENIHSNILTRLSWEADPVLHYEETVRQVRPCFILFPKKKVMFALL